MLNDKPWSVSQVQIPELINILELILSNPQ